jgi:hypothetical protein
MAKVTQPHKEHWESGKKSDCMILVKKENNSGIVKSKGLKPKRRSKKSGLNK